MCITFKLIDLRGISCVHAFKKNFFLQKALFSQASLRSSLKSAPSLSPHTNYATGENTFVTSVLSDIATGWLDEVDTTLKWLVE